MARALRSNNRFDLIILSSCVLLALAARALPNTMRDPVATAMRRTFLAPLVMLQERAERGRQSLLQADANSGVIITDWYTNPRAPGERVKLTVAILDQDLRADALRIAASRQVLQNGTWTDAPVSAATVQKLEDIVLTRARDLRRGSVRG